MKRKTNIAALLALALCWAACGGSGTNVPPESGADLTTSGQSAVKDEFSKPNVVQVAIGSPDHTTLVAAVQAAGLVDALSNVGPFTVFAPINAAFDALPAGTLESLLKPENKASLTKILEYHVYVGVIRENIIQHGMKLNQVDGSNVILGKSDGQLTVNGAKVLGVAEASNGIVYIIDQVPLPE